MKKLNREKVIRMVGGEINNRIGISSSGGSGGLAGAATQAWVDANYVSIEFFDRLFQAYSGTGSSATRVNANDTESTIDNIKAMFGFWTEQYLSTLGQGSGGGGGGGASSLSELLDVALNQPSDGQSLVYDSSISKWVNRTVGGTDMSSVWSALSVGTSEQINVSHLTNALSGYVTTSAISDMATKSWVSQQGYATQTWVGQNYISIAYFDRLFRAYNGSTLVNHNDTTTTIDNIKSMFGFWTDFYLSALGNGGQAGGAIYLSQLADVVLSSPTDGQALIYDAANSQWVNGTITSGVSSLSALSDVQLTAPATYQVLMYDASTTKWYNSDLKTINGQPLYGSGDISVGGGASGNYLPLSGGTLTGRLTINYDPRLKPSSFYIRSETVNTGLGFGNSETSNNSVYLKFKSTSYNSGSNNNRFTVDFFDNDDVFDILANGNVGIGTRSPQNKLDVNGDVRANGKLTVSYSTDEQILISGSFTGGSNQYSHAIEAINPSLSSGEAYLFDIGRGKSTNNTAYFGYVYGGQNTSYATIGLFGHDRILNVTASENVGIGTTSPEKKLDVAGSLNATTIYQNGVALGARAFDNTNYLPLTGGTLTGNLTISRRGSVNGHLVIADTTDTDPRIAIGSSMSEYKMGFVVFNLTSANTASSSNSIRFNIFGHDNLLNIFGNGNVGIGTTSPSYKLHVAGTFYASGNSSIGGTLTLTNSNDVAGTSWNSPALCIGGTSSQQHIEIDNNEIMSKSNASTPTTLFLNAEGGTVCINQNDGNCGIGTASPSYKLHVAGSIYATGGVTALSDARMKDVKGNLALIVDEIANAPAVEFTWKGERVKEGLQAGTLAQYWQKVLPMVVMDKGGELSMQYGVAALVSSIITARKVVDHEKRIAELERENKELKMKLKIA